MAFQFQVGGEITLGSGLSAANNFTVRMPTFQYKSELQWVLGYNSTQDGVIILPGGVVKVRMGSSSTDIDITIPDIADGDYIEGMTIARDSEDLVTVTIGELSNSKTVTSGFFVTRVGYRGVDDTSYYTGIMYGTLEWEGTNETTVIYDFNATSGTELIETLGNGPNGVLSGFTTGGFINNPTGTIEQVVKPTEFDWFTSNIWEDGSTDFDVTVLKDTGTTRYVDYTLGDNSNDGSSANPWKTLSYARAQSGVDLVVLAPGEYWNDCPGVNNTIANANMSFVCEDGRANIYACSEDDSANFEPDPTRANVYMWVGCPSRFSVWDAGNLTELGFWGMVKTVTSADEVRDGDVTLGRGGRGYEYYDTASQTLYVKTQDLRAPDKNIKVNTVQRWNSVSSGKSVYFEGVNFHFNVLGNTASSTGTQRIAFYKCFAGYGSDTDNTTVGLDADSTSRFYLVDSVVANSQIDNIGYRSGVRALELNSQSYNAGFGGPNNCSTAHGSASVIRLNCNYQGSDGPTVGDIDSVTALNVNCIAGGGSACFDTGDATTTSWYLNCETNGGGLGFDGGGTVYLQDNVNANGISGSLTVNNVTDLTNGSITKEDDTPPLITVAPPTTYYSIDKSTGGTFSLPIATSKDGKAVTTITPSTNTYVPTSNGDFTVIYTSEDSEFNEATPVTLTISQFGIIPSVIEPAINDAIFAKLRSLGYTGSYNDMWSQFWTDPDSLDCP